MVASCCNGTTVLTVFCGSFELWTLLMVVSVILVVSLGWNIICCIAKQCSEKGQMFPPSCNRSQGQMDMEENPIYGNINFIQTRADPPSSSLLRDDQRHKQPRTNGQDCYANLTLKPPKSMPGRSSPKIQYSDVVTLQLQEPLSTHNEPSGNMDDTVSTVSDLYASVQTERSKVLHDTDDAGNGRYANHI